ncbi:PF11300 domain protein [Leptospira interrogans str. 2006001854]|nr:PF11300 domain protein [Leptospira interrogans str. 2006001854]
MLGHGKFIPWIATNLPFSERTAQRYIKLFENRDLLNTTPVSDLKSAYKLLSSTDHEEKEINPKEISKVDAKKLYKKFKAGEKIGSKDRGLIKEFLSNERERILSTAKTKVARIDEDIKSLS